MDETSNGQPHERLEQITSALDNGLIVVDRGGLPVWMDAKTRRRINGGLERITLPIPRKEGLAVGCFAAPVELPINSKTIAVCVLQETEDAKETGHDLFNAVEAILSDSSWFSRVMVDKLKAWWSAKHPQSGSSDLEMLSHREREVLGLICQGRSDDEMSQILALSRNTVRNHIASLYRKIGVNRRAAAIIWARERGITSQEFAMGKSRNRSGAHRH